MPYCTIADTYLHGSLPKGTLYSFSTIPTSAQVTSLLSYVCREIDGRLSAVGLATPVVQATSPIAYAILTDLNALGAAAKALRLAYTKTEPNTSDWVDTLRKEYQTRLDSICASPSILSDASRSSSNVGKSGTNDLWNVDTPDDITKHRFYRGQKW